MYGADLRETDLTEANLSGASLIGANLSGACLTYANFTHYYLILCLIAFCIHQRYKFKSIDIFFKTIAYTASPSSK